MGEKIDAGQRQDAISPTGYTASAPNMTGWNALPSTAVSNLDNMEGVASIGSSIYVLVGTPTSNGEAQQLLSFATETPTWGSVPLPSSISTDVVDSGLAY
jgi:hypothetical protein